MISRIASHGNTDNTTNTTTTGGEQIYAAAATTTTSTASTTTDPTKIRHFVCLDGLIECDKIY